MRTTLKRTFAALAAVAVTGTGMVVMTSAPASAADTIGHGYSIPHEDGSGGSWIGSYTADGMQVYCGDAEKDGPALAGGYGPVHKVDSWKFLNGKPVPKRNVQRAAWILSVYGKSTDRAQTAAVDSAVYALLDGGKYAMGAARSEQRLRSTGQYDNVKARFKNMMDRSYTYGGQYRLNVSAPKVVFDKTVAVTTTLKSEYGTVLAGVPVTTDYPLDSSGPKTAVTNAKGVAVFQFKATKVGKAPVKASAANVPVSSLSVKDPSRKTAQRMLVAGVRTAVPGMASATVVRGTATVVTQTSAAQVDPGASITDIVKVKAPAGYKVTMTATLYGPFNKKPTALSCTPELAVGSSTRTWKGSGTYETGLVGPLTVPGYYTWVETAPETATVNAVRTVCGEVTETTLVNKYVPHVRTVTSDQRTTTGSEIFDTVFVKNVPDGQKMKVTAYLYGPAATENGIDCSEKASHRVTFTVTGSGEFKTPSVTVHRPGWYGWVEKFPGTETTKSLLTKCKVPSETTFAHRPGYGIIIIPTGDAPTSVLAPVSAQAVASAGSPVSFGGPVAPAVLALLLAGAVVLRRRLTIKNGN